MPQTPAHITVDPLGYTLSVTITPPAAGSTLVLSRRDGSSTYDVVSMPTTISAPTNFWLTDGGINVTVSLKLDAHEVAADSGVTQVVSVPASGGKAIRPSADALRTATSALTPAAASAAYAPRSSVPSTITYNADGTVATVTETDTGAVITYTYNADGTPATEARLLGGVTTTRTFTYTSGNLTAVA